ncbi:MAG: Class II abasic (AP) endonuclease, partial [Phylliscum demangeonii]
MFDILEADVVVMQETKIQRKDLRDDMVLVPGWDCFFSLPRYKKGYSGVAIYTRQSVCAPIRAEEGITGILQPPNSASSYRELPAEQQIGGYPTVAQLAQSLVDAATLDCEGRCVLLEFPAFVLIGVYSPANRDESRDDFRLGFLDTLDARVRNLVATGKRVILTGDLNISREEIDTANAEEQMRRHGLAADEFVKSPARRLFNQLLVGGKVFGDRDEGRETPVLWDICRGFHPARKGMFTCWEQKINARPGNFGSRIDYVLCSDGMRDWFGDCNIQEGLLGSDHCPVYATIKDKVPWEGSLVDIKDIMNPPGTFRDGKRHRELCSRDMLPLSGKLIPEFDRRRNIRDMFTRKPSLPDARTVAESATREEPVPVLDTAKSSSQLDTPSFDSFSATPSQESPRPSKAGADGLAPPSKRPRTT